MSASPFRSDIQGLRAIAVLAVMTFHFNPAWLPGGFVGVDVFLVISGFLITSILLNKRRSKDYCFSATLKYFYSSRLKRIVPAYCFMLVVVSLVAAVLFLPKDFNTFSSGLEKAVWFNSNNYFADFGNYFVPENYEQTLLHTWSLAIEIQFYLLAPFIVLLLPVHWLKWVFTVLLAVLSLIAEYRLRVLAIEQETYYSLYARLPEFFAGSLVASYTTKNSVQLNDLEMEAKYSWLSGLGVMLVLLATIAQPTLGPFPGVSALLPVVGSALLLLSKPSQGWIGQLLSSSVLVWLGALSYSLYLWHWPVLAFLRYYSGVEVLSLANSLVFVGITLMLSLASYYLVERAFRAKPSKKRQLLRWSLLITAASITSVSMAKVNQVFTPEELPVEYRRYADPERICHGKIVGDCLRGDLSSVNEVLVLGDSHAAMLNHFFDYLGKELEFKARIITASSCVTILNFDFRRISEWAREDCITQINHAAKYIPDAEQIFLAASWNWHLNSSEFDSALDSFLENFNKDINIQIIGQEPLLSQNPLRIQRFKGLGIADVAEVDEDYIRTNSILEDKATERNNVNYLDLGSLMVFDEVPYWSGRLIYYDEHHLNEIGVKEYARQSLQSISQELLNAK